MSDAAPNPELMRSLGRLVRGLSALFWGLPAALVICFHTAKADMLRGYHFAFPLASTGLLVFGLWELGAFQKQERIWRSALDRARVLGLVNFGLSPFLYWFNKMPTNEFYQIMVLLLSVGGLSFLASLNVVLQRLGAILPDETLRLEIKQFTALDLNLLLATAVLGGIYVGVSQMPAPSLFLQELWLVLDRGGPWFLVILVLLPVAMTMALLWKTKEVILDNVFGAPKG